MKKITLTFFISVFTLSIYSQIILNGDFENNTASQCHLNLSNLNFNTMMSNSFAFGLNNEIDIQNSSCGYGNPEHGNWFISLATNPTSFFPDGLSLTLNSPFFIGNTYEISFFEKACTTYHPTIDTLLIGISSDSTLFGNQIYSSCSIVNIWTQKNFTFTAPLTGKYLTIKNKGDVAGWNFIDDFQIVKIDGTFDGSFNQSVNIFPNPSNGNFTISTTPEIKQIQIYNSVGQLIQTKNTEGLVNLNFNIEANGFYIINLITDKQSITKKLIVYK